LSYAPTEGVRKGQTNFEYITVNREAEETRSTSFSRAQRIGEGPLTTVGALRRA